MMLLETGMKEEVTEMELRSTLLMTRSNVKEVTYTEIVLISWPACSSSFISSSEYWTWLSVESQRCVCQPFIISSHWRSATQYVTV